MPSIDPYSILEARILSGAYPPGSLLDSERELAGALGVHRNTIRRALARLADAGLLECRHGYRPVVRRPAESGSRTIALLMGNEPRFHSFQMVMRGCESELREEGYRLAFMDTLGPSLEVIRDREREALQDLLDHPVAGVILWSQYPPATRPYLEDLARRAIPVVAIDRTIPDVPTDFVGVDNVHAAREAVEFLISLGHERIGFATTLEERSSPALDREEGYRMALRRRGIAPDERLIFRFPADCTEAVVAETVARFHTAEDRPTALFTLNDILAWQILGAAMHVGLQVPKDLALVGFDDIEALALHSPVLTTVRQPYEAMGRNAARLLFQRLRSPSDPIRHVLLETTLIERSSTQPRSSAWTPAPTLSIDPRNPVREERAPETSSE